MSHVPHELHAEFPDDQAVLHSLKLNDAHFARLSESYHETNREIHRIEAEVDAASDERLDGLKKQRLTMLDEIGDIVRKARANA